MNGVALSEPKTRLCRYVRSFKRDFGLGNRTRYPMRGLPGDSGGYLSALHNLRILSLNNIILEKISEEGFLTCFSAFRETLTKLYIWSCAMSFSAFVTMVDYFPNLTVLQLGFVELKPDEGSVPSLSRPLRGTIRIDFMTPSCLGFANQLAKLDLEYDRLVIGAGFSTEAETLAGFLQISPKTVKYLGLIVNLRGEHLGRTLSSPHSLLNASQPRWKGSDHRPFSTAPRVGTVGNMVGFGPRRPPLFDYLHPAPQGRLPLQLPSHSGYSLKKNRRVGFN
jgi:hypothetical protein